MSRSQTVLKQILIDEGRKQTWLAARVGIDPGTLNRIVHGLHADRSTREAIASALGRDACDIWTDHDADGSGNAPADAQNRQAA